MATMTKKKVIGGKTSTKKTEKKSEKVKEKAPAKKKVTDKKAPVRTEANQKGKSRGRKSGVRYEVKDTYSKRISDLFEKCENALTDSYTQIESFLNEGKKSAAKEARASISPLRLLVGELRKVIQTAKQDMKEVKITK